MKSPILQVPDMRLRAVAVHFPLLKEAYEPAHHAAIQDLRDTFSVTENCVGLAATQLGRPWRVIIVDVTPKRDETYVMVNPIIVKASDNMQAVNDGCKSVAFGKKFYKTHRPKMLTVEWIDPRHDTVCKQKFRGLIAAAIHHEIDHLNGIIFLDRIAGGPLA